MIREYIIRVDTKNHKDIKNKVEAFISFLTADTDPAQTEIQYYTKTLKNHDWSKLVLTKTKMDRKYLEGIK